MYLSSKEYFTDRFSYLKRIIVLLFILVSIPVVVFADQGNSDQDILDYLNKDIAEVDDVVLRPN